MIPDKLRSIPWKPIGAGLAALGLISSIFLGLPDLLAGAGSKIGPLQASALIVALMMLVTGLDLAMHVKESGDAGSYFRRYRSGYLYWFGGQILFVIFLFMARQFGPSQFLILPLELSALLAAFYGLSLLIWTKMGLIRASAQDFFTDGLARFDAGQESLSTLITSLFRGSIRWLIPVAIAVLLIQFLLFRTNFSMNFAPYFPAAHDQLGTLMPVYEAAFSVRDQGVLATLQGPVEIKAGAFRGWSMPALGVISTFLFGPNRLAVAYVNFLFFVIGQVALWTVLYRWKGLAAALAGEGLLLYSRAYSPVPMGGMMDLRFDFAGMITLGISFLALITYTERPSLKKLFLCLLCFQISLSTRSITMVYILGIQGLMLLYFIYRQLTKKDVSEGFRFCVLLLAGTLLEVILFVFLQWQGFDGYYLNLLRSGEGPIRDAEFRLTSPWERPLFFWNSIVDHFQRYSPFPIFIAMGLIIKRIYARGVPGWEALGRSGDRRPRLTPWIFLATGLSFFVAVNNYSPSPVVSSVLTIPLVFTLAVALVDSFNWLRPGILTALAVPIFLLGFWNYTTAMIAPGGMPYGSRQDARIVNNVLEDISQNALSNSKVYWMRVDQALNDGTLYVYWVEQFSEQPPINFRTSTGTIFPVSETQLLDHIDASDMIVIPLDMQTPPGFDYPYDRSIRELKSIWQPYIDEHFNLAKRYSIYGREIGLYIRNARLLLIKNKYGVEDRSGRTYFWFGDGETQFHIQAVNAGSVTLTAELIPEPGLPENPSRTIRVSSDLESYDLLIRGAEEKLSFTIAVSEGENVITLSPLDWPGRMLPDGVGRPLLLGILICT